MILDQFNPKLSQKHSDQARHWREFRRLYCMELPMTNRPSDLQTNIVQLSGLAESTFVNTPASARDALISSSVNDPTVVDGLRLLHSFQLIEEGDTRQSIIQIVEKMARTK
jgi:hypothetical protein